MTTGIGPLGSEAAAQALRDRLALVPGDKIAWHNLAVELRKLDRPIEALEAISHAWGGGLRLPETSTMRGHILADLGRYDEAIRAYRMAVQDKPELLEAQAALAKLLPQVGQRAAALEGYHAALQTAPASGPLWVAALEAAKAQGEWGQLLSWADAATARFGPDTMVTVFAATALSALGRDAEAFDRLSPAAQAEPDYTPAHTTLAHLLIKLGEYAQADQAAGTATQQRPMDQSGWALLGVVLRLLNDEREHWLCDYERLVMPIDLGLPAELIAAVEARHDTSAHPADQSVRGGTQTRGNLFHTADPVIQGFARDLAGAVETRLAALPSDPTHPFHARNTPTVAFSGAWSVRLRSEGFHISHIHPEGWLSSALYLKLPPAVQAGGGAGALAFGVPDAALGLDLPARRIVHPREGQLVLFPSYLWHGTTPFVDEAPRLTLAFDALPVDRAAAPA